MFGKIKNIEGNTVILENINSEKTAGILNYHVVFEEENLKLVGEIIAVNEEVLKILLVGEIKGGIFSPGTIKVPNFNANSRLIYKEEVSLLLGNQNVTSKDNVLIGNSSVYNGYIVSAGINDFFANHFAIIGNTGSGKSCGVASLLQNVFYKNQIETPKNSRIVIFDAYGEYTKAFSQMDRITGLKFKKYTTSVTTAQDEILKIPAYFLGVDDLALLLEVSDVTQLPIIEKALKLVYIFTSKDEKAVEYKNDIIAKSILDILSSGKSATQIRDQVVAVLTKYNTPTLNLDSVISEPGYNRTLKQCLNIDPPRKTCCRRARYSTLR